MHKGVLTECVRSAVKSLYHDYSAHHSIKVWYSVETRTWKGTVVMYFSKALTTSVARRKPQGDVEWITRYHSTCNRGSYSTFGCVQRSNVLKIERNSQQY